MYLHAIMLTARWERRYSLQVSATEKALLVARNAKISVRELERVLGEERAETARAAQKAATCRWEGQGGQGGEAEEEATTARFVLRPTKRGN